MKKTHESKLTGALSWLVVVCWAGCTCAEYEPAAPGPTPVAKPTRAAPVKAPPVDEQQAADTRQTILTRVEQFCTRFNEPSWALFGIRNPFYARIRAKVRGRGEELPAQLCRNVTLVKVDRGSRAVVAEVKAEFVDPRLPGQWIPKPQYCFILDSLSEYRVLFWNDKPAGACKQRGGYFQRLDQVKGTGERELCEAVYREQERWLLRGGRATVETCLGEYRGPRQP